MRGQPRRATAEALMDLNLAGEKALVICGCRGIGESISAHLAAEGSTVIIPDVEEERSERTLDYINDNAYCLL